MKYLFFDVECSNCFDGLGKICEYGYVLMDENFNTIKKDDIPMSPGRGERNRFHLKGRKDEKDLELAYEYDYYYEQPEFSYFYERIKNLMNDEETICFAYSMENDIHHLDGTCRRYKKEPLNYICYDVQKMVSKHLNLKNPIALRSACLEIVGSEVTISLQEHLSRDDAEMTRLIFKKICEINGKSPSEMLKEFDFAKTNSIDFIRRAKERADRKRIRQIGFDLYRSVVSLDEELDKPENIGKRYNISGELKTHLDELKITIELVKSKGGLFSLRLDKTDFFIVYDEDNKKRLIEKMEKPFEGQFITYKELIEQLAKI